MTKADGVRILLVDSDIDTCEVLSDYLQLEGFLVSYTTTVEEAVKMIEQTPFDLIMVDPFYLGTKWLKSNAKKAIIATSKQTAEKHGSGFDLSLIKPFDTETLIKGVRALFGYFPRMSLSEP